MTKKNLVNLIAIKLDKPRTEVSEVISQLIREIVNTVSTGNRVELRNFGIFEAVHRKQKIGRNPRNSEVDIVIPACHVVKFSAGKNFEALIKSVLD